MDGELLIEKLIAYASAHLHLPAWDEVYFRNVLMSELGVSQPCGKSADKGEIAKMYVPDVLAQELREYAIAHRLTDEEGAERYVANIFGLLTPLPSEINRRFLSLREKEGAQAACDDLYDLCVKNGYIQKTAISRNLKWECRDGNNRLEITVNLSKPEKSNKEIAKLLTAPQGIKYPACALCKENEGFEGTATHPPRRNLRTVKVKIGGEPWFMQYSPYAYYDEHCIVINERHTPMRVDAGTPDKLLDFVDFLPGYFIGSNASLPIVGGSILNHEHYQGGRHLMPMHFAPVAEYYESEEDPSLEIGILDWYNSAIQVAGEDRRKIAKFAASVIEAWKNFDCPQCDVISHTGKTPHNAVSPICRKVGDRYVFTMILRNNRTDERYPDGIFHVHPEYLNIKSEGIGLIEAMGLFILPPRLKRQLDEAENILCGAVPYEAEAISSPEHDLYVHRGMIAELMSEGVAADKEQAHERVQHYVNRACASILDNTAVFKKDANGREGFSLFMDSLRLRRK